TAAEYAAPYLEVPFPINTCAAFEPFNAAGLDAGYDSDGDGVHETISISPVTALRLEPITVPVGTFPHALRVGPVGQRAPVDSRGGSSGSQTTKIDWYAAGVGPVRRVVGTNGAESTFDLIAYSVGQTAHGVLPQGALARDLPESSFTSSRPAIAFGGDQFL